MKAFECPVCHGRGCANCHGSGVLAADEQGREYYVALDSSGGMQITSPKEIGGENIKSSWSDRFFAFWEQQVAEPHDLLWVVKQWPRSG